MLKLNQGDILLYLSSARLHGWYREPAAGNPVVVFAQGNSGTRHDANDRFVSERFIEAGFGTLLFDLLTEDEDRVFQNRLDVPLLSSRLVEAVRWSELSTIGERVPMALYGANAGAAAALAAAGALGAEIRAVVSHEGRVDLAADALPQVLCPTLFLVGALDFEGVASNRDAMRRMPSQTVKDLQVVPGATRLSEEPGALTRTANLARDWIRTYAIR